MKVCNTKNININSKRSQGVGTYHHLVKVLKSIPGESKNISGINYKRKLGGGGKEGPIVY